MSALKSLSTDTSFIKIGVCCQKLSILEFNFHYRLSSHCDQNNCPGFALWQQLIAHFWIHMVISDHPYKCA